MTEMRMRLYGNWTATPESTEYTDRMQTLIAFLDGSLTVLTVDEAAVVREEFLAMNTALDRITVRMEAVVSEISKRATSEVPFLEVAAGPREQYECGHRSGSYVGYSNSASIVREALLECSSKAAT